MSNDEKINNLEMELEIKDTTISELQEKVLKLEKQISKVNSAKGPNLISKNVSNPTSELVEDLQTALKTKDVQIKSKEGQIRILETDKINLKKELQDLREMIQDKESKIMEFESKISLNNTVSRGGGMMNELVEDLEAKIKKQKRQIDKLNHELRSQPKISASSIKTTNTTTGDSSSTGSAQLEEKNQDLKNQLVSLNGEIAKYKTMISEKEHEISELQDKLLESKVVKSDSPLNDLVDDLRSQISRLKGKNQKMKVDIENYKYLEKSKSELDRLNKAIKEKDLKIQQFAQQVEDLNQQYEDKIDANEISIRDLKKQIITLTTGDDKERIEQLSQENKALQTECRSLREVNEELNFTISHNKLEDINSENASLKSQNYQLSQQLENINLKIKELEKELDESGARQQIMRIREMRSILDSMKKKTRQQMLEINDLRRRLAENFI